MGLAQPKYETYTYADYLTWPDECRVELIDGEVYDMSPAPSRRHQDISRELLLQIASHLKGRECSVYAAPFDVRFAEADESDAETDTVVQPDISVICDPRKLDDRGCKGAPDFIAEILSPSTASKDYILKKELYERYGVKEYWLLHPHDNMLIVYQLGKNGKYSAPTYCRGTGQREISVLPDMLVDLDAVFAGS
ncbi:MAG: Uma2 family endonuclease [Desulfobacterales bacterium]